MPSVAANDDDIITLGSLAPHLLLHLGREQAHQPEVAGDQAEHPPRRRVALGDLGDHLDRGLGAELGTAPARRLVDAHETAGDELLHGRVGDAPERFGLGAPVDQVGGELARAGDAASRVSPREIGRSSAPVIVIGCAPFPSRLGVSDRVSVLTGRSST